MKKVITILFFAVLVTCGFDCYAQNGAQRGNKESTKIVCSGYNPLGAGGQKKAQEDRCNNTSTSTSISAAVERAYVKAAKENAGKSGSSQGTKGGGSTATTNKSSQGNVSSTKSCSTCTQKASALQNRRNK